MEAFLTARFIFPVVLALTDFFKLGVLIPNFIVYIPLRKENLHNYLA